jgi:uncharacterized repeat protein (TIGR04042 family)
MPEIHFQIEWPDGLQSTCYSPSLVILDYFEAGKEYALNDFIERSRTSLQIASNRVYEKYGMHCSRAQAQLQQIEEMTTRYDHLSEPRVRLLKFID